MSDKLSRLLRSAPVFREVSDSLLESLTGDATIQTLPKNTVLFRQGEIADFLYFILAGRVVLIGYSDTDEETVVEFFQAGDLFVAPAVILDLPLLMSVKVIDDETRILRVNATRFRELLQTEQTLALAVSRELARHWRMLVRQIKDLKLRNTAQRVASYLLGLVDCDSGSVTLTLPGERRMVAARLGMTPESLSRAFLRLRELGVSGSQSPEVEIADIAALREFCRYDGLI